MITLRISEGQSQSIGLPELRPVNFPRLQAAHLLGRQSTDLICCCYAIGFLDQELRALKGGMHARALARKMHLYSVGSVFMVEERGR